MNTVDYEIIKPDDITVKEVKLMKHAIGFSKNRITGTKHRVMHAFRNYFCDSICTEWERIKAAGLAERGKANEQGYVYYHLNEKGLKFIADITGLEKIVEID